MSNILLCRNKKKKWKNYIHNIFQKYSTTTSAYQLVIRSTWIPIKTFAGIAVLIPFGVSAIQCHSYELDAIRVVYDCSVFSLRPLFSYRNHERSASFKHTQSNASKHYNIQIQFVPCLRVPAHNIFIVCVFKMAFQKRIYRVDLFKRTQRYFSWRVWTTYFRLHSSCSYTAFEKSFFTISTT